MRMSTRLRDFVTLLLLLQGTEATDLPTVTYTDSSGPCHAIETGTCAVQTKGHVIHAHYPTCSPGEQVNQSPATVKSSDGDKGLSPSATSLEPPPAVTNEDEAAIVDAAAPPFMSFEDWKEEMLKRTGQDPQELRSRKANEQHKSSDRRLPEDSGTVWGDDEEIELNFGEYAQPQTNSYDRVDNETEKQTEEHGHDPAIAYDHGKGFLHRSKDAGKTCKERFSYSSFDAGATILKTGPGTKNPKAILVENKDSYMLLECGRENKFVIVELSDDILLDTVVLANFEFFSSMIRHFRISVSDRYPVKVDKWRELGTFEARNSRDIQAFLVENPQIWAKYVRIEFLTHYGNEYYCPVSLIRIHGTRMLDSWKEADGAPGEDAAEDDDREARQCEDLAGELTEPDSLPSTSVEETLTQREAHPFQDGVITSMDFLAIFAATCPVLPTQFAPTQAGTAVANTTQTGQAMILPTRSSAVKEMEPMTSGDKALTPDQLPASAGSPVRPSSSQHVGEQVKNPTNTSISTEKPPSDHKSPTENPPSKGTHVSQPPKQPQPGSPGTRSRGTPTSNAAIASPTVQEGFFNSITKRLAQVESNLTLSMKYIEDQSRHVQEAMQRLEQKQSQRISLAHDTFNDTMTSELRRLREQHEQLWQFTLKALDSQRERNEQDAVALSARLNLLADEVVFQKRMAIAQAVLLLSCLFLVIFSRGVPLPYLATPQHGPEDQSTLAASQTHGAAASVHDMPPSFAGMSHSLPTIRLMTPESTIDETQPDDIAFGTDELDSKPESSYHVKHTRFYRPSPPLTPRAQVEDDLACTDMATEGLSSRLPASDQHNTRKPLPALPEDPLSP